MISKTIPFRPKLEGEFRTRFHENASHISELSSVKDIESIVSKEIDWVENECKVNLNQRKKYRAIWLLFRDLIHASWKASYNNGVLEMKLPSLDSSDLVGSSDSEKKSFMRSWMQESRNERLGLFTDFITKIESINSKGHSISDLIADGEELCKRLQSVRDGEQKIEDVIKPYLQLVSEGEEDKFTGIKTSEIWRYFRLTWSTPSETTPGRTMQYLIRDAAHPMHAVMGIASLENCAVQITCRDEYIGWNVTSYTKNLLDTDSSDYARNSFEKLISFINKGVSGISYSDLCSDDEVNNPTEEVINRLALIAEESEEIRQNLLKSRQEDSSELLPEEKSDLGNISKDIEIALYRRKRSDQLSKLLYSKKLLHTTISSVNFDSIWKSFVESETGRSSIRTALISQKSNHIGSSMMELNVCGAIPPYNEILGGKLVALLALSPQVISDYRTRYSTKRSEIASRIKGEDVLKPADLAFIGTTSLYYVGSSQYNRIKIPGTIFDKPFDVRWKEIGNTVGFGTLHISKATTLCLSEAVDDGFSRINHVFGEGSSPKMRLLTMAIRELLETSDNDSKEFSKHAMSRIVYGAELAKNTKSYLLGDDSNLDYYFNTNDISGETQKIINYWRNRWALSRLQYEPIYDRIKSFDKKTLLVSSILQNSSSWKFNKLKEPEQMNANIHAADSGIDFIRKFYRGSSAYADFIDASVLSKVHVKTKLDDAVLASVRAGNDVVLTGNPGDGKTHIIRMLMPELKSSGIDAVIELDASTLSNEQLYQRWKSARLARTPFVLAINAAVLFSLEKEHPDTFTTSAKDQLLKSITYSQPDTSSSNVVVFDLSKREVLTKEILHSVIENLCSKEHYSSCSTCTFRQSCPTLRNVELLSSPIFQERILYILERTALQGYHATVRELQSMISYLLFGGRSCELLPKTSGDSAYDICNLVYSGKGNLFNAIRNSFDPSAVSHPIWDELLISPTLMDSNLWDPLMDSCIETINPSNDNLFKLRKRQFYFFNQKGDELLKISNDNVSKFQAFLKKEEKEQLKDIISKLNVFFSSKKSNSDLGIWTSHRFNNQPRKILMSIGDLPRKYFRIGYPVLNFGIENGIDYYASHVRFEVKDNPGTFLKIDFSLYNLLLNAEKGVPALMIESEDVKRIWRFMDQLNIEIEDEDDITISLLDLQNKRCVSVGIDLDTRTYTNIELK